MLAQLEQQKLFLEAWGEEFYGERGGYIADPERWARDNLKDSSLWQYLERPWTVYQDWDPEFATVEKPKNWTFGVLFDIIELLHRDAVAVPGDGPDDYDQDAGQRVFRDAVNPVLAQLEPPKVLTESGEITDVADVAKESILAAIVRRSDAGGDTPALSEAVYDHILDIIKGVGNGMELDAGDLHPSR